MASNLTLQSTVNWALSILFNKPLAAAPGMEPSITNGNLVMQTVLGPPFCWRWNRASVNFVCNSALGNPQDYATSVPLFGFIETAAVFSLDTPATDIKQLEVKRHIERTAETARPNFIAPEFDDGAGNITFRLTQAPDKNYPVTVTYQKKAPVFTSLAQTWSPLPDEFSYIFNNGFLALSMMYVKDERFGAVNQKFLGALLGAAEGLSEMEQNLFLTNWLMISGQLQTTQLKTQQGNSARGV